ncbi:DnaB-like helicase C-terminal domain-containing protein [Methylomonas sp. UP202]|uniref:replicative DNA helicase n=1 Tax=Methylomonas sp. UP202 TaxID=3040943 RepID=UPI002478B8D8|nr:DnaB-like helicase C-terminal domain-containing protein [Methylomonas sp. UP202]WGS85012.1 DnaB-like helicase C-terminal domain-containing protein [Methylomonas sp. UP202]
MSQTKQTKYEEAVVHILLNRPAALAGHEIDEKWFTKWRPVISTAKAIAAAGNEPDMLTISEHIKRPSMLGELNQVRNGTHAAAENLPKYLDGLRSIYQAAHVQQTLSSALAELQGGAALEEVLGRMMQSTLTAVATESRNYNHSIKQALGDFVDKLEEAFDARETGGLGLQTGISALDRVLGGMHPTDLLVVGARPAVGKTAFGLSVLLNLAKTGKRVGIISTEMAARQLMLRVTAANSGIAGTALRDANLQDADWPNITAAINRVANLDFRIFDKPNVTISDVALQSKAWAIDGGLDFMVVDYLTRIKPVKSSGNQTIDIGEVAIGLKNIARQIEIPVMALAQLNRSSTKRADKRPNMADLRDSGVIEQEADQILLLHRDDDDDLAPAEIIVDKNRHGEVATVRCCYLPQTMQWTNLADRYVDAA